MNNKGFSLIELLGSLIILGLILGIGLFSARGTLGLVDDKMNQVSENEIFDAASLYVIEDPRKWINDGDEYTCFSILELVDYGYFDESEVEKYHDDFIRVVRNSDTKVVENIIIVDSCE